MSRPKLFTLTPLGEEPFVSIIVPYHWGLLPENSKRFIRDFRKYFKIDYENYEVILVTDRPVKAPYRSKKIVSLVTHADHATAPSEKRDLALKYAKGEICVFIDDDAYPKKDWLKKAVIHFQHPLIVGVGGPGVTPPSDSFWEKVGGAILESKYCSGKLLYRYYQVKDWLSVDDYPGYNLFIRTDILKKVGGFNSTFYYGEDTRICIELIRYGKILYDPEVVVYHHRRAFLKHHLKQIWNTGVHRGYFVKAFPLTSRRWLYFIPMTLTLGFLGLVALSILMPSLFLSPTIILITFFWLLGVNSISTRGKDLKTSLIGGVGIILSHMAYAIGFIKGLSLKELLR